MTDFKRIRKNAMCILNGNGFHSREDYYEPAKELAGDVLDLLEVLDSLSYYDFDTGSSTEDDN